MKKILLVIPFIFLVFSNFSCNGQNSVLKKEAKIEKVTIVIPFSPGSCHQCDANFYRNLKLFGEKKLKYIMLLPDEFVEDLNEIKKEYNFDKYPIKDYVFSTTLFEKYHVFEQNYVLQFGVDSNYKIYNNADSLFNDYSYLNKEIIINFRDYAIKPSAFDITVNSKDQLCVQSIVKQNSFDFIDLKNKKEPTIISFSKEHLLKNFILFFKDTILAQKKLNEVSQFDDIPNKNVFDRAGFYNDSLFIYSKHTFIENLADSSLGGFRVFNIYKDGKLIEARSIGYSNIPKGYIFMEHFHFYNNKLYIKMVKQSLESEKPNYFLGMFELENGVYQFKKMLNFIVPQIHNNVGYTFLELRFSDKYFMTSISNILFNLETEQIEYLNIPTNKQIEYKDLVNGLKGANIVIDNINVQYPNLIISYFSKDAKGKATNVVLNYDMKMKKVKGQIKMPMDNSRFVKPDILNFGYYLIAPEKVNCDYLLYKKLF